MTNLSEISQFTDLIFDNRFVRELPADPETENHRRQVLGSCYSRVLPTRVAAPRLIACAQEVAELLNLSPELCASNEFIEIFSGNRLLPGMEPYAVCYGGHQFGYWAGQLGDGRAINLGDVVNRRGQRWALQLKGAGPTPYSRNADGLAVLRSSIREFLCSEAMFHLGVPTTRALSVVLTGEPVVRDMFYNGNPAVEPGAIVCRVAPSFTRFGNFQIHSSRGELAILKQLADYTIRTDFPHLDFSSPTKYSDWYIDVCRKTAEMIVHWQRVGFVHGVMNTDNMSILGLTIDYGPYGWLDNYDPEWTPNTTDAEQGRYRFGHQPQIAYWNLVQLANALYPIIEQVEPLQQGLQVYTTAFNTGWQNMMKTKLGLTADTLEQEDDLLTELLRLLQHVETDMTLFFRKLALLSDDADLNPERSLGLFSDVYYQTEQLTLEYGQQLHHWLDRYLLRSRHEGLSSEIRRQRMKAVNPKYVLRNYLAQLAIDQAEQGDFSMVRDLLQLLRRPYDEQPENDKFAIKRPEWARNRPGCSTLSCSS